MTVFAIGDVQGCYDPLRRLLDVIQFDPEHDQLWFCGDLVNRGPDSLAVLRYVHDLGDAARVVLGNHDLHLLALALQVPSAPHRRSDTLEAVLQASDRDELIHWLRHRPLLLHSGALDCSMVHAGLAPQWTVAEACQRATEVEAALQDERAARLLDYAYRNRADRWDPSLQGMARLGFILACLTRMRFCGPDGTLNHRAKGPPGSQPAGLMPWFELPGRAWAGEQIVFGHWAALGRYQRDGLIGLDSGCVWGNMLSAIDLGRPKRWYGVDCHAPG